MSLTYADTDREPLETEWTWQNRLPRGHVVLVVGWRASGKGLLACSLAAAVTTGRPLPGETEPRDPGDVIMITAEDDPNEDMPWRLRAAGADLSRVHDMTYLGTEPFELSASATVQGNTTELLATIRELREEGRNPRLVILDPLNALVMSGSIKTDQGARRVIARLEFVARRTGVTILVMHHRVKSGATGGSQGLEDAPRWVYTIDNDPLAPEYRVFHLHKCNVATGEDLRYRIISEGHDSRIEWADRAQIEHEERAWRERKPALAVAPELDADHAAVFEWLNDSGGGSLAECAEATGLDEDTCRELLAGLADAGLVKGKRRLASPFRKSG